MLITLGIIGVVAALTLPVLINKYQMKVYETAFKKQYSVLQNAINYVSLENGYEKCYLYYPLGTTAYAVKTEDCEALQNGIIEALKLQPINKKEIRNNYASLNEVLSNGVRTINRNCSLDYTVAVSSAYQSNDGTFFMFADHHVSIIIDINGEKGPNKWGYDVFYMTLALKGRPEKGKEPAPFLGNQLCSLVEKGGRYPEEILQNKN